MHTYLFDVPSGNCALIAAESRSAAELAAIEQLDAELDELALQLTNDPRLAGFATYRSF